MLLSTPLSFGRNPHLVPVIVQPLDDFEMAVPRREDHGVHGATFRTITAEELEESQVSARGCIVNSGSGAPLSAIFVQESYHLLFQKCICTTGMRETLKLSKDCFWCSSAPPSVSLHTNPLAHRTPNRDG